VKLTQLVYNWNSTGLQIVLLLAVAVVLALGFGLGVRSSSDSATVDGSAGKNLSSDGCRRRIPHRASPRVTTNIECSQTTGPAHCPSG